MKKLRRSIGVRCPRFDASLKWRIPGLVVPLHRLVGLHAAQRAVRPEAVVILLERIKARVASGCQPGLSIGLRPLRSS